MELNIGKWGNSQGVRLPKELLRQLSVDVGASLEAVVVDNALVLRPVRSSKRTLRELLDASPGLSDSTVHGTPPPRTSGRPRKHDGELDWGLPVGKEEW